MNTERMQKQRGAGEVLKFLFRAVSYLVFFLYILFLYTLLVLTSSKISSMVGIAFVWRLFSIASI